MKLLLQDFDQPLRIEQLACELGMSVSSLQHRFKAVTALSPQQFQKHLRLQEARRLMLGEALDAASAASRVGYQDAAHFNRPRVAQRDSIVEQEGKKLTPHVF